MSSVSPKNTSSQAVFVKNKWHCSNSRIATAPKQEYCKLQGYLDTLQVTKTALIWVIFEYCNLHGAPVLMVLWFTSATYDTVAILYSEPKDLLRHANDFIAFRARSGVRRFKTSECKLLRYVQHHNGRAKGQQDSTEANADEVQVVPVRPQSHVTMWFSEIEQRILLSSFLYRS